MGVHAHASCCFQLSIPHLTCPCSAPFSLGMLRPKTLAAFTPNHQPQVLSAAGSSRRPAVGMARPLRAPVIGSRSRSSNTDPGGVAHARRMHAAAARQACCNHFTVCMAHGGSYAGPESTAAGSADVAVRMAGQGRSCGTPAPQSGSQGAGRLAGTQGAAGAGNSKSISHFHPGGMAHACRPRAVAAR